MQPRELWAAKLRSEHENEAAKFMGLLDDVALDWKPERLDIEGFTSQPLTTTQPPKHKTQFFQSLQKTLKICSVTNLRV
jgi:hypothetical protein